MLNRRARRARRKRRPLTPLPLSRNTGRGEKIVVCRYPGVGSSTTTPGNWSDATPWLWTVSAPHDGVSLRVLCDLLFQAWEIRSLNRRARRAQRTEGNSGILAVHYAFSKRKAI